MEQYTKSKKELASFVQGIDWKSLIKLRDELDKEITDRTYQAGYNSRDDRKEADRLMTATYTIISWTGWNVLGEIEKSRFNDKEGIYLGEDDHVAHYCIPNMSYDDVIEFAKNIDDCFQISEIDGDDNDDIQDYDDLMNKTQA